MNTSRLLKLVIPTLIICFIVGYTIWQLRHIIDGPTLTIEAPNTAQSTTESKVKIAGEARQIDWLFLNNRQIFTDESGHFDETILAAPGYNVIQLTGRDKFGRFTIKNIELVYATTTTTDL